MKLTAAQRQALTTGRCTSTPVIMALERMGLATRVAAGRIQATDAGLAALTASRRHPKNETRYITLDVIAADPRVVNIWDEDEDGIWIALVPGYNWEGCSCVHEWTVGQLIESFKLVTEGDPS